MIVALNQLVERFPPRGIQSELTVDWDILERNIGFTFPPSHKNFIDTYGGSVWFDNLSPIISSIVDDEDARRFLDVIDRKIKQVDGDVYDEDFNEIDVLFYPHPAGLFPFLIDYSGNTYFWDRKQNIPEKWPVIMSKAGWTRNLGAMSIPEMIIAWLDGELAMKKIWGNIDEMPTHRMGITEEK